MFFRDSAITHASTILAEATAGAILTGLLMDRRRADFTQSGSELSPSLSGLWPG
jgi:hypothetical protein